MLITCISTSNTKLMGENSTSTKVCNIIKDIIHRDHSEDITIETVPLMNYNLKPCILCGECSKDNACIYDEDFNKLISRLSKSDAIFFVVPHYSPIPSKLIMIFEKINEIMYAGWIRNPNFSHPISGKPIGIVGHGGMAENDEVLKYYHDSLITPVANTFKSLSFNVIGSEGDFVNGAPFGLKDSSCLQKVENALFPAIVQDWDKIENRVKPLVDNVMKVVATK